MNLTNLRMYTMQLNKPFYLQEVSPLAKAFQY